MLRDNAEWALGLVASLGVAEDRVMSLDIRADRAHVTFYGNSEAVHAPLVGMFGRPKLIPYEDGDGCRAEFLVPGRPNSRIVVYGWPARLEVRVIEDLAPAPAAEPTS